MPLDVFAGVARGVAAGATGWAAGATDWVSIRTARDPGGMICLEHRRGEATSPSPSHVPRWPHGFLHFGLPHTTNAIRLEADGRGGWYGGAVRSSHTPTLLGRSGRETRPGARARD